MNTSDDRRDRIPCDAGTIEARRTSMRRSVFSEWPANRGTSDNPSSVNDAGNVSYRLAPEQWKEFVAALGSQKMKAGGPRRQRARGASMPWYRTKLMRGRGVIAANRSRNSCAVKI